MTPTDRLLTDDDLRAIAARASWTYVLIAPDVQSIPDTTWYVTRKDTVPVPLILAAPDEGWARGMMDELTRRDNDARLLLAHIRAQDAELARLWNDLAIIEQGCNSPWMTGAAFKDRVADLFAARRALLEGGAGSVTITRFSLRNLETGEELLGDGDTVTFTDCHVEDDGEGGA